MKEKETKAIPVGVQTTQPTKLLFREQWEREVKLRIQRELGCLVERIYFGLNTFCPFGGREMNIPSSVMNWIANNPAPKRYAKDPATIADLTMRIEALEAALAEKGGTK